jgi:hypothetical protein
MILKLIFDKQDRSCILDTFGWGQESISGFCEDDILNRILGSHRGCYVEYYLMGCNDVWSVDVSENHIASIFRIELAEQDTRVKIGGQL